MTVDSVTVHGLRRACPGVYVRLRGDRRELLSRAGQAMAHRVATAALDTDLSGPDRVTVGHPVKLADGSYLTTFRVVL